MAGGAEPGELARLRDGTVVGAWLLKANPAIWDIGTALRDGTELDWWRMAPSYRAALVAPGHPCVMWVTRGDHRVPSGIWAIGSVTGAVHEDVGDPDDPLWRDDSARRQLRPRLPVHLEVLARPVPRAAVLADPRLERTEVVRVPRIGNPAVMTPDEFEAVLDLAGCSQGPGSRSGAQNSER